MASKRSIISIRSFMWREVVAGNLRAFYFEPRNATNKVRDDAVHLVAGFEHAPRSDGHWTFTRWALVDLSRFKVKLKADFRGAIATSTGRKRLWRRARSELLRGATGLMVSS